MAIGDDFSVDFSTGNIRYTGTTANYTVLELHRWLQGLADDPQAAGGANDDLLDISSRTPSERITDQIITLIDHTASSGPRYNIDDTAAEHLYGGSITQGSGSTEELYSGLRVLGAVVSTATQIQVIQDKTLPYTDSPFWGDQVTPYNGSVTGAILMRILVKSRVNGCDIDEGKIIVRAANYGDTFAFFNVTLGQGEAVAAISTVDDPQNDTASGTVAAYTHVTNTEGFQLIDISDGNGDQPYYSQWTYGADTAGDGLKSVWEWGKYITRTGTASTIHGIDGELFLGVTHSWSYDNLSGTFTEDEEVVWGTQVTYDNLSGGTFTAGNYIIFSGGAVGRVMYDNGSTDLIVALEDTTITITDGETITEYNKSTGATSVTADVNVTIVDNDKSGGSGILLASDTSGSKHHIQLRTGSAPVDNLPLRGLSSAATALVNGSVTAQTVTPTFLGSYVGSMIGGFGVGFDPGDLSFPDTVTDLDGDTNNAPNNVTFSVNGVSTTAPDYVMVGEKETGIDDFNWNQTTLNGSLTGAAVTSVVVNSTPPNTPTTGWLRITADDGRRIKVAYTAVSGTTFTITSHDFSGADTATTGNDVMVMPIDKTAASDPETFTTVYTTPQTMFIRVRFGGAPDPIKTFQGQASLGNTGGSTNVSRLADA